MKISLVNTDRGLVPYADEDFELKNKLKLGEVYTCTLKVSRNLEHHRKYFKMIATAWEFLPEYVQANFRDVEIFRKQMEMCAGYFERVYSPMTGEWADWPKSIAFDKLDQDEFEKVYNGVRNVIDALLRPYISEKEFEENILRF